MKTEYFVRILSEFSSIKLQQVVNKRKYTIFRIR